MSHELISKKARYAFREYFVGTTLREIEIEFDAADVPFDTEYQPHTSGARRSLVEQYYHAVDWSNWKDVRKILTVYENVLAHLESKMESGENWAQATFSSLKKWIEKDGFKYDSGRLVPTSGDHAIEHISAAAAGFDSAELTRQIARMKNAVDDDPDFAVGTAKELVETTCKIILRERGTKYDDNADICKLVKETRRHLGLVPDSIPESAKGAEVIRRLLSNLGNVAQGLGELRNLYGTGHGRHGKAKGLSPRHARLAVGSAATLCTFLFETHKERTI